MNFGPIEYTVARLDGDYAYLQQVNQPQQELKCVARALLPPEISEGTELHYEMMEYTIRTS
ncbi:MAG: chorismate--pyruvate lyase [Lachnospiraceae bacterium]|nr:chorismate--pyruvate lyase [Lachnospiraceae bacterium]